MQKFEFFELVQFDFCICNSWCGFFESISVSAIFWVGSQNYFCIWHFRAVSKINFCICHVQMDFPDHILCKCMGGRVFLCSCTRTKSIGKQGLFVDECTKSTGKRSMSEDEGFESTETCGNFVDECTQSTLNCEIFVDECTESTGKRGIFANECTEQCGNFVDECTKHTGKHGIFVDASTKSILKCGILEGSAPKTLQNLECVKVNELKKK